MHHHKELAPCKSVLIDS